MFFLGLIEHTLHLHPYLPDFPLDEAIKGELESFSLDKVWRLSIVFAFSFCYCDFRASGSNFCILCIMMTMHSSEKKNVSRVCKAKFIWI